MEFANIAEFRQNATRVFARLKRAGELVVLRNGRPVGLLVAADAATLDVMRVAAQRARAQMATVRLRRTAKRRGLDQLSNRTIVEMIRRSRQEKSAAKR